MTIIDLNLLPAPDVVETLDYETILAARKATFISLYPRSNNRPWPAHCYWSQSR